ncbi:MAG TPA: malonic semialdehyde reductase [Alphaproteobacteria bacterium]|nr:malonic semialdehyde reductase [Rhodospirillaceae bacterium]HRJ12258.1 malonic semialdehyde reductase [Alphaproteobacteria bacterium]
MSHINAEAEKIIFTEARTQNAWLDKAVPQSKLHELYDLMKWGPTSTNCSPLRIIFLTTDAAKERIKATLAPPNVPKTMAAPVVAILARDIKFYEQLPFLSPHNNAVTWFKEGADNTIETARRNATLQGAYFMIAARAVGLDCAPMSGFDAEKLNKEFFEGTDWEVDFICALGHGDTEKLYPRGPRLSFDQACKVI